MAAVQDVVVDEVVVGVLRAAPGALSRGQLEQAPGVFVPVSGVSLSAPAPVGPAPLPPTATTPPDTGGRKYRSKKQRPCDLCRSRKIHCKVGSSDAVCECCRRLKRVCTFEMEPLKRRHRPGSVGSGVGAVVSLTVVSTPPATTLPATTPVTPVGEGSGVGLHAAGHMSHTGHSELGTPMALDSDTPFWLSSMPHDHHDGTADLPDLHPDLHGALTTDLFSPRLSEMEQMLLPSPSPGGSGSSSVHDSAEDGEGDVLAAVHAHAAGADTPWLDWPPAFSLEARRGYSHHHIGLSCEADPFLLRYYSYDNRDLYAMFRLDYRRVLDDATLHDAAAETAAATATESDPGIVALGPPTVGPPAGYMPVQFALTDEAVLQDGVQEAEAVCGASEAADIALVQRLVSADVGARLVRLYCRCVHPRLPVLALHDLAALQRCDGLPIGLLSAVYALAVPFSYLDDALSLLKGYVPVPTAELWAVAERSAARAACVSHLSSLQLLLLLLQRPPYNDAVAAPPAVWARSCAAIAAAETLGLGLDPAAGWRLPRREAALRRRLWWLAYTQHVWHAVGLARPCHVHADSWDVSMPVASDLADELADAPDEATRSSMAAELPVLLAHWRLSVIAAEVLKEFYTFRSVRESASLTVLLSRAQPLRSRIEAWRQTLPLLAKPAADLSEDDLVMGASLRLAHLTLEVLIFRALLRPLRHDTVGVVGGLGLVAEPMATIYDNCYTCAKVGTEIVAAMKPKHFATFWACYSRYQLCYIASFILLSLAQAPTLEMARRFRDLLHRWRDTLRTQARAWPLARLATIRLDAIYWKGLPAAVMGAGEASPAVQVLREG